MWGWLGRDCQERLDILHLWRCSKLNEHNQSKFLQVTVLWSGELNEISRSAILWHCGSLKAKRDHIYEMIPTDTSVAVRHTQGFNRDIHTYIMSRIKIKPKDYINFLQHKIMAKGLVSLLLLNPWKVTKIMSWFLSQSWADNGFVSSWKCRIYIAISQIPSVLQLCLPPV